MPESRSFVRIRRKPGWTIPYKGTSLSSILTVGERNVCFVFDSWHWDMAIFSFLMVAQLGSYKMTKRPFIYLSISNIRQLWQSMTNYLTATLIKALKLLLLASPKRHLFLFTFHFGFKMASLVSQNMLYTDTYSNCWSTLPWMKLCSILIDVFTTS